MLCRIRPVSFIPSGRARSESNRDDAEICSIAHVRTDNLAQSAQGFRKGANRVRKQMVSLVELANGLEQDVRAS